MTKAKVVKSMEPNRQVILDKIGSNIDQMYVWGHQIEEKRIKPDYINHAIEYAYMAQALIEILEVHDCGSTGGFDPQTNGNKKSDSGTPKGLYSLEERYDALKRKYPSK